MYTITLMAHTHNNAPFQKTSGWQTNPAYGWVARMDYSCDNLRDAQAKADILRRQFWKLSTIGDNDIRKYVLIIGKDGETAMLSEFTGRGKSTNLTSHLRK